MNNDQKTELEWSVYLLECRDGSIYCGITKDISRRLKQHNDGVGAKYTRGRGPVRLLKKSVLMGHGEALRLELQVKRLPKNLKLKAF
jgi:putative endonuclease